MKDWVRDRDTVLEIVLEDKFYSEMVYSRVQLWAILGRIKVKLMRL